MGILVWQLAQQLDVTSHQLLRDAEHLKIKVGRIGAQLNSKQEAELRAYVNGRRKQTRRQPVAPAMPPAALIPSPSPARPPDMRPAHCRCCDLAFTYDAAKLPSEVPARCAPCDGHFQLPDEKPDRKLARFESHEALFRRSRDKALAAAADAEERMRAAFSSRQKWIAALAEVILAHEETPAGGCSCGAGSYPCFTVRGLEESNRGISRRVEMLGTLTEKELDAVLHPKAPWEQEYDDLRYFDEAPPDAKSLSAEGPSAPGRLADVAVRRPGRV